MNENGEDAKGNSIVQIPAKKGRSVRIQRGCSVRVINTHGQQVVDTWAFNVNDFNEAMSMEHTRAQLRKVSPTVGDTLYSNYRRPLLSIVEDTSGGIHDTMIAACDVHRYKLLGYDGYHDNCTDNLLSSLSEYGIAPSAIPCPFNLFMNIPIVDNALSFEPPLSQKGSFITLRAEMDIIVVFSACPQDMVPVNGINKTPTEAHYELIS